jgi:hypothetical protein
MHVRFNSCCKRRIMLACRSRIHLGNGSTCPHAHIRSSLISVKVRTASSVLTLPLAAPGPVLFWLESVTQGLARATSHRVLAPAAGTSPRYSIPFFQNIAQDLRLSEQVLQLPPEVLKLKGRRGELGQTDRESDI